ncbi:MAG: hypothetical protein O6939_04085, partial [Bacteroidetes bacterium]|nr:hypothetical protein [Bacteroidota bacterium]
DSESYQNKKGQYVHYVAMQMSTADVEENMVNGISNDSKLKQDFELKKFREIYQQELDKFSDGNR